MKRNEKKKLLNELQSRPNKALLTTVLWTTVLAVLVCCLIAKEAAQKSTVTEVNNYVSFSFFFVTCAVILVWVQLLKVESKIGKLLSYLEIESQSLEDELDEEDVEDEDEDDEEEDEDDEEEDDEDEDEEDDEDEDDEDELDDEEDEDKKK